MRPADHGRLRPVSPWFRSKPVVTGSLMLKLLEILQLVLYIPMLALVGQGALFVLAGPRRETNFFYTTLRLIARPFTFVVRKVMPARVADHHVPIITFALLAIASFAVFAERGILLCEQMGYQGCRQ